MTGGEGSVTVPQKVYLGFQSANIPFHSVEKRFSGLSRNVTDNLHEVSI